MINSLFYKYFLFKTDLQKSSSTYINDFISCIVCYCLIFFQFALQFTAVDTRSHTPDVICQLFSIILPSLYLKPAYPEDIISRQFTSRTRY